MTEKTFSPNDPMIKRRIRARATDSVTEKIQAIRKIAGYVSKISSLYHDQYAAAHLVRRYVTGFPERSYTLESLESIGDRVKIFYIEQKALYDRRERHGVAHAINLLEELFEDQGEGNQEAIVLPSLAGNLLWLIMMKVMNTMGNDI